MSGRLAGKVAFITGTAGGQGRAAALVFSREGANVVACDIDADGAQETAELVQAQGGDILSVQPVDLRDQDAIEAWVEAGVERYGRIDVLYNNAGAVRFAAFEDASAQAAWDFTMSSELDSVFKVTRAAWPHLRASGGSIVNVASAAAIRALPLAVGRPGSSTAHSAAKAGVLGLTLATAAEGAPDGIRCNCVIPGVIESPATEGFLRAPGVVESLTRSHLVARVGVPEDIVYAALYFASDESSYVTGTSLPVDGGMSAQGGYFDIEPATGDDIGRDAGPVPESRR